MFSGGRRSHLDHRAVAASPAQAQPRLDLTACGGRAGGREVARTALEQVCSRGDMALAPRCYAEDFADYVGSLEYHGLDGVERSTAVYRALFDDLACDVVDQVARATASPAVSS